MRCIDACEGVTDLDTSTAMLRKETAKGVQRNSAVHTYVSEDWHGRHGPAACCVRATLFMLNYASGLTLDGK